MCVEERAISDPEAWRIRSLRFSTWLPSSSASQTSFLQRPLPSSDVTHILCRLAIRGKGKEERGRPSSGSSVVVAAPVVWIDLYHTAYLIEFLWGKQTHS